MKGTRRRFLELAGISVLSFGTGSVFNAFASGKGDVGDVKGPRSVVKKSDKSILAERWGMVIDTRRIHSDKDLYPMIDACNKIHNIPIKLTNKSHIVKWIWQEKFHHAFPDKHGEFVNESLEHRFFPVLCNHCAKPACVRVCPTKATFKRPSDGVVLMDFHRCIGCRFCMAACPFGARSFNFRDPRPFIKEENKKFPTRMKGVVEKCNFCAERLAVGRLPACVEASGGVFTFGDLQDPNSEVRTLLRKNYTIRRKQSLGTEPSVYYIV